MCLVYIPMSYLLILTAVNSKKLKKKLKVKRRFEVFFQDLKMKKSALAYRGFFIFRRMTLIYMVFYSKNYVTFQIYAIVYTNLFLTIYQGYVRPLNTVVKNRIENFNEFMV